MILMRYYDFRLNGNDQIVAGFSQPSSSYSRSLIYNDSAQIGSTFSIDANSGNLPTMYLISHTIITHTVLIATLLANNFSGFYVS